VAEKAVMDEGRYLPGRDKAFKDYESVAKGEGYSLLYEKEGGYQRVSIKGERGGNDKPASSR
jgi:hypothetical protein